MSVRTAGPIVNDAGRLGTLGPLLKSGQSLFSVVAFYNLQEQSVVLDGSSSEIIATVVDPKHRAIDLGGSRDIVEILRQVAIKRNVPTAVGKDQQLFTKLADPADYVGATILKSSQHGTSRGVISALDAPFHMLDSLTNKVAKFEGAFEVKSVSVAEPFAQKGDAGSSIYAADGALLGILVGVAGDAYYAVPAEKLAERFHLAPARLEDLLAHNRRAIEVEIERPEVNEKTVYAFYGAPGILSAEERLNESALTGLTIDPRRGPSPRDQAIIYQDHHYSRTFAPRLGADRFLGKRDMPLLLQAIASNTIAAARFNFIVGIDGILKEHEFTRDVLVERIYRLAQQSKLDHAEDVARVCLRHLDGSEYSRLIKGRSVSAATAWLALRALQDIDGMVESRAWKNVVVEPAIFVAKESASVLWQEFEDHHKLRKSFDAVFHTVAVAMYSQFPLYSGSKVVEAIAEGRPVRYTTAWMADRAAQILRKSGFRWKRAFFGLNKHAPVEEVVAQNVMAIRKTKEATRRTAASYR